MAKVKITCECGHIFSAELQSSNRYFRCPECDMRIYREQVEATRDMFLATGVKRITGFASSIEGSLVVTIDSVSFIGPYKDHPLSSGMRRKHDASTFGEKYLKEIDAFIDSRKGKRTLYEQIMESSNIEEKIKQLAKYRQKSVRIRRKSIRTLSYDGGYKLVLTTPKNKYTFTIPKPQRTKLQKALRQNRYIKAQRRDGKSKFKKYYRKS